MTDSESFLVYDVNCLMDVLYEEFVKEWLVHVMQSSVQSI
jgi:hypothetical protein